MISLYKADTVISGWEAIGHLTFVQNSPQRAEWERLVLGTKD